MSPTCAVIFDLDGTLIDSLADLAESMNFVLEANGLPMHSQDAYRYFIGEGVAELIQRALPDSERGTENLPLWLERYRASYDERWHRSPVFEGIADLLDQLVAREIPMAVVSNKPDAFTQQCVAKLLPHWKFDSVIGHSGLFPRKPNPSAALEAALRAGVPADKCFFVGDSDIDIQTGVNANMHAVGVSWGFRPVSELRAAGAHTIIDTPAELLLLLPA